MKFLANWAMASRMQAIIAIAACLAIPLLFWLGAALLALVVLRQEWKESSQVLLWSVLPAVGWMAGGDPTPFISACGTVLLALILRSTVRLDWAVLTSAGLGVLLYFSLPLLLGDLLPLVTEASEKVVAESLKEQADLQTRLLPLVGPVIQGVLAALHTLVLIVSLLLGRHWQSALYNPGGFGEEFGQLRLPLAYTLPVVVGTFWAGQIEPEMAGILPILTMPMMIAGLAFFHGLVKVTNASPHWVWPIYIGLMFLGPYMYALLIFVAWLDSLINIRARLKDTALGDD